MASARPDHRLYLGQGDSIAGVECSRRCSALEFGHHEAARGKLEEVEVVAVDFECAGLFLDVHVGQDLNDVL